MNGLYEWIRNITYYLIFITVIANLLPNRNYEKYFKMFAGMVLILLVLKPFTGGLKLDDRLAYYFESITFQNEVGEFSKEMTQMEEQRLKGMIGQYEEAVETDLKRMAEADGLNCTSVQASIDKDQSSEKFGHVISVKLLLNHEAEGASGLSAAGNETAGETESDQVAEVDAVEKVTPVLVDRTQAGPQQETPAAAGQGDEKTEPEKNNEISGLRRHIAEYYDLEEQDIEIQLENGKR